MHPHPTFLPADTVADASLFAVSPEDHSGTRATLLAMHLISWNVNGLRALHRKAGLVPFLEAHTPDVLMLQETKAGIEDLPDELKGVDGYQVRLFSATRKGYSGTGVYTRYDPDEWIEGIGDAEFDAEGRVLGARFGELVVLSAYFPNSQAAGARLPFRLKFGAALLRHLQGLRDRGLHVVLGGDFNVAHQEIDLARPKQNQNNPGFLPEERQWMSDFLAAGYVDTWRRAHPDTAEYSWWSYRFQARQKNIGWRLDYLCVDSILSARVRRTGILGQVEGSDHCPVELELDS